MSRQRRAGRSPIAPDQVQLLRELRLDIELAEQQLDELRLERVRVVGVLLAEHRLTQGEIASIAGITQARVSQIGVAAAAV